MIQNFNVTLSSISFFSNFFNVYLFFERERQRQRQSVSGGGAEKEGDTESEARSRLRAVSTEPDEGLKFPEMLDHDLSRSQVLN